MQCLIYKGHKKQDSYIFIEQENDFTRVPQALLDMLGRLEYVMSLELDKEQMLARVSAQEVISHLTEHGFYLQLPPGEDLYKNDINLK